MGSEDSLDEVLEMSSFENTNGAKKVKKRLRNLFPGFWKHSVRLAWEVRVIFPFLEPALFKQLRKISSSFRKFKSNSDPKTKKKFLFFQTRSNPPHLSWAGTLALSLKAQGHDTLFLGCSRELQSSCNNANHPDGLASSTCRVCYIYTRRFFSLSGINHQWISNFRRSYDLRKAEALVNSLKPAEYAGFRYRELPLGELVRHSVAHYLRTGSVYNDPLSQEIYRHFLINSVMIADASFALLEEYSPDVVLMLCGLFMPERVMMEIARSKGIRVVTYEIAMLAQDALMMQHNRPIDYDDKVNWLKYKNIPLTSEEEKKLDDYLFERSQGRLSVVNYWPEKEDDEKKIRTQLRLDPGKKIAVLFPNITWDSALFEKDIAFNGMFDWLDTTIEYFSAHPDYQLVIRAHPAEVILPGSLRESVISYILCKYPKLPPNIILVPPESKISSYTLMDISCCALSYASTTAIELGVRGVPTLVAGEVHFRNKGFTIDIEDRKTYFSLLSNVISGNSHISKEEIILMAKRYAYFTFFRVSMPFNKIHCGAGDQPVFTYEDVSELLSGKDKSLDIICNAIVTGSPFIFE